jgi:alkylation response protein AidB-like acyl-CoA dehydrogenase
LRACPVGHLDFPDLPFPRQNLIVSGLPALSQLHDLFLPAASAILIALLKSSLDYALEYGRERYQGGKMIVQHSHLRAMYGRMNAEYHTLRQALLSVLSNGASHETRLALKVMAAELAVSACTDGVQLLGGYGYTMEYPQEKKMRDARQAAEILGSPARLRLALADELTGDQ